MVHAYVLIKWTSI